jgi:hypothetical protein
MPNLGITLTALRDNPVKSRHHEWQSGEQEAYGRLHRSGRTFYDSMRTAHDLDHETAWRIALQEFGYNKMHLLNNPTALSATERNI